MKTYTDFDLTAYNSYNLRAMCRMAYFPENESDILELFKKQEEIILIGSGHNLILSQEYYQKSFVIFNGNFNSIELDKANKLVSTEAGASARDFSIFSMNNELEGAEFLFDIPSSMGGAVVMNAGTKEGETRKILDKVRFLDLASMKVIEKSTNELELEYRTSLFQKEKNKVILKAWFKLSKGKSEDISNRMEESKKRRWSKQPREYPNSGSVFKRPPGRFVGPMLDELDLKGFSIGDAQVSTKHSGFIVNKGNATGKDILSLINHIQSKVKERFAIDLEVEQRII